MGTLTRLRRKLSFHNLLRLGGVPTRIAGTGDAAEAIHGNDNLAYRMIEFLTPRPEGFGARIACIPLQGMTSEHVTLVAGSRSSVGSLPCRQKSVPHDDAVLSPRCGDRLPVAQTPSLSGRRSLRLNTIWALAGNSIYAACQWGIVVLLAKLGPPELVGQFALALAVTAPIITLSMLQLRAVQATDAIGDFQFGHYLALRIATAILALLAIGVVVVVAGYRAEIAVLIFVVGLLKAVESVSDAYHGLIQKWERMDRIAWAQIIKGPLFLVALTAAVYFTGSLWCGVAVMAVASVAVLYGYERPNALCLLGRGNDDGARPLWQWRPLFRLAWLCLPLGIVMMLLSLNRSIPRLFIERVLGERELGFFAALAYLQVAGSMVVRALGQSASPRLAKYYAEDRRPQYLFLLGRMSCISLLLGAGGIGVAYGFGPELLTLLYRPDYAPHSTVLTWLMVASGLSYVSSTLGYGMTAARYFRVQAPIAAIWTAVTAYACFLLVPHAGLLGAAQAMVLASSAKTLLIALVIWRAACAPPIQGARHAGTQQEV